MNAYDKLVEKILNFGVWSSVRDGQTKCKTLIAERLVFDQLVVPRRKVQYKAAIAELLWFLSGSTYVPDLEKLGCRYWNQWVDPTLNADWYRETNIPQGYIGPTYGFQLRHFGANYFDVIAGKKGGFDQLQWLIQEMTLHPDSRRMLVSLWNPVDFPLMRLPPCAYSFHLQIINSDTLYSTVSLIVNMRSCDVLVGLPYNIIFYYTFLQMINYLIGSKATCLIFNIENAHIYQNQIESAQNYLRLPELEIEPKLIIKRRDILEYQMNDFDFEIPELPLLNIPVTV